ncbi:HET-domain-containing protein [Byssothecium circinans]|uniref:HET-domain-containing protein n=1 Tax=Byssothecium circinans TaxID=147558 RepID=A0A6A5TRS7_9PLEO|nr:HET-domain-containing protein [Byssothecium circinans]
MYRVPSTFYPHQPSVSALKQSAVNGCGFCQFMVDCLHATASSASDRPSTDELATTVSLGLYVDTASENGNEVSDAHNVGLFFIQLKSAFPTVRCNFDLFTPSAQIVSVDRAHRIGKSKPDPNLGSSATFDIAKKWLNECQQDHLGCLHGSLSKLPTRVVDVGTLEVPLAPRLIISNGLRARYIALSHCWGGNIAVTLTKNTLSTFQAALPYTELPQNFRDAITITQELGVRYLWIDSLCIIQDSKQDWASESALMGIVYRDSTVTISAMASANSSSGILNSQEPSLRLTHKLRVYENKDQSDEVTAELIQSPQKGMETMDHLWRDGPLTFRGWTLQEFVLSPRHLFYGRHQIYWKCPDGYRSVAEGELRDSDVPVRFEELTRVLHRERLSTVPSTMPDRRQLLDDYYTIVCEYCRRSLTKSSDKLPAFSGIASGLLPVLGGDYVAGIWTSDLVHGLLWRNRFWNRGQPEPCVDSSAPSWSWAAAPWIVYFPFRNLPPTLWQVRLLSHDIVPVDKVNPFGQIESARLVLEGFTIPVSPVSPEMDSGRLVMAGDVEPNQCKGDPILYHPVLAAKRSQTASTLPPTPHNSRDQPPNGREIFSAIREHRDRNAALPEEVDAWLGDEVMVDSPDFKEVGYRFLLVHARTDDRSYWVQGLAFGLMLRPVRDKSGDVYERVGYAEFYQPSSKWLQTLEKRVITLV